MSNNLSFTNEQISWLIENNNLLEEIENLSSGSLIDPCDKTPASTMIEKTLSTMKVGTLNDFDNNLSKKYQAIKLLPSMKKCPRAECLLNKMIANNLTSDFLCELLQSNDSTSNVILRFGSKDFLLPTNPKALAETKTTYVNPVFNMVLGDTCSYVNIIFNSKRCGYSNKLTTIGTILHELIHADIRKRLLTEYGIKNDGEFQAAFKQLVLKVYGDSATINDHHLMLKYYVDKMVNNLKSINGDLGVYEDYEGEVLNAFGEAEIGFLIACGYPIDDVYKKIERNTNFINNPDNISPIINECP